MALKEQVYSVLVVSPAENFNTAVEAMLPKTVYQPVVCAGSIAAAQRTVAERSFDFIIINAPLGDDLGARFAIDCSTSGNTMVLFLIQNEIHADVYSKVAPHGVFTLPKPMTKQTLETALRWMRTAKVKLQRAEKKTTSIEDKMQEIRLVNKAKWLLITNENMAEPEAHRYIEKTAMDRCIKRSALAEEIINKYE